MSAQIPSQTKYEKQVAPVNEQTYQVANLLLVELLDLGFDQNLIKQAVKNTDNKQKAVELILRFQEHGLNANIADIIPLKSPTQDTVVIPKHPGFPYKMIFLVNMQLKMGKGKICAQVGHACLFAYLLLSDEARFDEKKKQILNGWETLGCAKIVVRVQSTKELQKFKSLIDKAGINSFLVEDAGKTQIKSGSKTVLGIGPVESAVIDPITKDLKLL